VAAREPQFCRRALGEPSPRSWPKLKLAPKAHAKAPYTVDNTPAGFVVHVLNAGGGFQLAVVPDMTLRGSGSTTVHGKLISNFQGEKISFVPHSESCNIGALAPRSTPNTTRGSESRTNPE
jgi:hypothetical protein